MTSLMHAVQYASFARRNGAKVTCDGSGDVYVHDCPRWGVENMRLLHLMRPNAEMTFMTSVSSTTGFVIVIHEPAAPNVRRKIWLAAMITAAVLVSLYVLRSSSRSG